ncbi:hypothetical protein CYMTET_27299 [Cymbomonas tetramitiformis]|uniref:Uncharacterized protein n=1 Tax=Cymbomonas tetramitiformis TaxID=36881 RepID=A0AAE0KXC2_9CHLO|nr:hypothetical protein CYMTET_27299 [Cymbomonas tetramitiformis]
MLRRVMSFVLQELYMNVGPRPQSIAAVGHALSFVLGAPEQMDEALYVQCQAFVRAMMKQTRHINEASAQALLSAIGNLMLNAHLETTLPSAEGKIEDLKGYLNDIGKILLDEMIAEELSISLAASAVVKMTLRQGSTKPHSWVFHEAITTYDGTTFNPISYQASIAGDEAIRAIMTTLKIDPYFVTGIYPLRPFALLPAPSPSAPRPASIFTISIISPPPSTSTLFTAPFLHHPHPLHRPRPSTP